MASPKMHYIVNGGYVWIQYVVPSDLCAFDRQGGNGSEHVFTYLEVLISSVV